MEKYPNIDKRKMGFGKGFEKCPVWNYGIDAEEAAFTSTAE